MHGSLVRLWDWINRWARRAGLNPRLAATIYPDYVVCPNCNEPEVEIWQRQKPTRCHNCGKEFTPPPVK